MKSRFTDAMKKKIAEERRSAVKKETQSILPKGENFTSEAIAKRLHK